MASVLYVDAENIKLYEEDFMFLRNKYDIQQIFIYTNHEQASSCSPTYHPTLPITTCWVSTQSKKNSLDICMSIDIIESVFHHSYAHYLVASHDRDYLSLYKKLETYQKKVTVIGYQPLSPQLHMIHTEILGQMDPVLRVLLKAFLVQHRRDYLSVTELRKNIKKLNLRKLMPTDDFKNIVSYIENQWSQYFFVQQEKERTRIHCRLLVL